MEQQEKELLLCKLAKKIKMRRYDLELTQEELAEIADFHVNYISGIERGERNVSFEKLVDLARALQLSPKEFMPEQ